MYHFLDRGCAAYRSLEVKIRKEASVEVYHTSGDDDDVLFPQSGITKIALGTTQHRHSQFASLCRLQTLIPPACSSTTWLVTTNHQSPTISQHTRYAYRPITLPYITRTVGLQISVSSQKPYIMCSLEAYRLPRHDVLKMYEYQGFNIIIDDSLHQFSAFSGEVLHG